MNIEKEALFPGTIRIEDRFKIGINARINGMVRIRCNVMMSPDVMIYTRNHRCD